MLEINAEWRMCHRLVDRQIGHGERPVFEISDAGVSEDFE